uniref:Uncharacterized protein n=1 Tax=Onchocerca volvulus TaxID=6282 RepID=A0A8R1TN69_ONCVO
MRVFSRLDNSHVQTHLQFLEDGEGERKKIPAQKKKKKEKRKKRNGRVRRSEEEVVENKAMMY